MRVRASDELCYMFGVCRLFWVLKKVSVLLLISMYFYAALFMVC